MRKSAAGVSGAQDFQCIAPKFNEVYFALFVDHKRDAIRDASLRNINAILLGDFAVEEIAQQRKREIEARSKGFLGWTVICTDGEYFRAGLLELLHSRLECFHFSRSATREGGGEESQHHGTLTDVVGEVDFTAGGGGKSEVGRGVANFERG